MTEELRLALHDNDKFTTADGQIIKNAVVEAALALNPDLLALLLANEKLRATFFTEVASVLVFDKVKFQRFVMNKNFLPDSYTTFKNRIGLTTPDGHFIADNQEVVLSWPYKDCILEGGQTKEDSKRRETFWNEILAPDQISILTSPKALANAKRYDAEGEHPVTQITDSDNLIIKGNNLLALHSLRVKYAGKVKLIYIDPPYNTGNDTFGYNDSFNHSTWLTFMKNRLEAARDLLSPDGVIFVQCDDNEQAYLKVLMDEVFRRDNFISTFVWKGRGGRQDSTFVATVHEYILLYGRDREQSGLYKLLKKDTGNYPEQDQKGSYKLQLVRKWGSNSKREDRPNLYYQVDFEGQRVLPILPSGEEGRWRWSKKRMEEAIRDDLIVSVTRKDGRVELYEKVYRKGSNKSVTPMSWIDNLGIGESKKQLDTLFEENPFDYAKPESLIKLFVSIATNEGDLVLDYHLGSGTTAAVAHKMGRRYIGVEQMDYIEDVAVKRLQKVIEGEQGGISKEVGWKGGGDFVYCELACANQAYIDRVMAATDHQKLVDIWAEMRQCAFLSYKISEQQLADTDMLDELTPINDTKRFLTEVLDKNLLYVPLAEIDSDEYTLTDDDRRVTKSFYGID